MKIIGEDNYCNQCRRRVRLGVLPDPIAGLYGLYVDGIHILFPEDAVWCTLSCFYGWLRDQLYEPEMDG